MKYIYGPVDSRRLGLSLGVSLTPYKICSFDCIYCQLGKTTGKINQREEYIHIESILEELKSWLKNNPEDLKMLNYITLAGTGEPTLNSRIGQLILEIKKISAIPLAVITNSSLLHDALLRQELFLAELILPSLDTATQEFFHQVNQPHESIKIEDVIEGLISLRREFRGQIWLEVMLVKGKNDDLRQIKKLKQAIERINPDKIQLNSPLRASSLINLLPVDKSKLKKIQEILGDKCEIL